MEGKQMIRRRLSHWKVKVSKAKLKNSFVKIEVTGIEHGRWVCTAPLVHVYSESQDFCVLTEDSEVFLLPYGEKVDPILFGQDREDWFALELGCPMELRRFLSFYRVYNKNWRTLEHSIASVEKWMDYNALSGSTQVVQEWGKKISADIRRRQEREKELEKKWMISAEEDGELFSPDFLIYMNTSKSYCIEKIILIECAYGYPQIDYTKKLFSVEFETGKAPLVSIQFLYKPGATREKSAVRFAYCLETAHQLKQVELDVTPIATESDLENEENFNGSKLWVVEGLKYHFWNSEEFRITLVNSGDETIFLSDKENCFFLTDLGIIALEPGEIRNIRC